MKNITIEREKPLFDPKSRFSSMTVETDPDFDEFLDQIEGEINEITNAGIKKATEAFN